MAGGAAGQARSEEELRGELISQLMKMQHVDRDASQRIELTSAIMALAEAGHQPSRLSVAAFARELTKAIGGRAISLAAAKQITLNISEVLRSSGKGTSAVKQSISSFKNTVSGLGANGMFVRTAASKLTDVGNEVRGPQDSPLLPPR